MYFFVPKNQAFDKDQIRGLTGVNPDETDPEVLRYLGILRIVKWEGERDFFLSPSSLFRVDNELVYEEPSSEPLPIDEAKVKARQHLLNLCKLETQSLTEGSGFPLEFLLLEGVLKIEALTSLKEQIRDRAELMAKQLKAIEEASNVDTLRQICFGA